MALQMPSKVPEPQIPTCLNLPLSTTQNSAPHIPTPIPRSKIYNESSNIVSDIINILDIAGTTLDIAILVAINQFRYWILNLACN